MWVLSSKHWQSVLNTEWQAQSFMCVGKDSHFVSGEMLQLSMVHCGSKQWINFIHDAFKEYENRPNIWASHILSAGRNRLPRQYSICPTLWEGEF